MTGLALQLTDFSIVPLIDQIVLSRHAELSQLNRQARGYSLG
jgi:hypothetical protein